MGEGERQAELTGKLRAEPARAEQPDLGKLVRRRNSCKTRGVSGEHPHHVGELAREVLGREPLTRAAQRERRALIGARCAPDAQVDAPRMQ